MSKEQKDLHKFIADFKKEFFNMSAEQISFPRSCNNLKKYRHASNVFIKGTPIHVRGALLYNKQVEKLNLSIEDIKNGSKVKFCYMKMPNPLMENVISFNPFLPKEFGLHEHIDYEMQFNKTFKYPLKLVSDAINWELEHINSLESFFG